MRIAFAALRHPKGGIRHKSNLALGALILFLCPKTALKQACAWCKYKCMRIAFAALRHPKGGIRQKSNLALGELILFLCPKTALKQACAVLGHKKSSDFRQSFFVGVAGFEPATSWSQTRRDDRATLHPEVAERQGLEPWRQSPVDRLAICSVTTPAPLLALEN